MNKKEIKVSYEVSGIKTLKWVGMLFTVIGAITLLLSVVALVVAFSDSGVFIEVAALFLVSIISLCGGAICLGLSSVAKTALYQRALMEYDSYFIEVK